MGAAGAAPLRGAASRARVGAGSGHGPFKPAAGTSGRVPRGRAAPRGGGEGAAPVRALTAANKVPGPRRGRSRPDTHRGSPGAPAPAPALGSRGGGGGLPQSCHCGSKEKPPALSDSPVSPSWSASRPLTVLCGGPGPSGRAVHCTRLSGGRDGKEELREMGSL
ncbi:collagen alpha-1(I) chain-like isoform X2 [Cavia porcellus]|uniref:collagen alpha-1(I) chain-like isoform X2 n=1 Tax=Cavia porcellus TaxID=10141 RepID=UPI002FE0C5F8